jgi:hypothetical protein
MKRPIPAAFTNACRAIEQGELALALMHSDALTKEHSGCAEAAVLSTFIHRRADHTGEGWLESLLSSWESCDRPTSFTFLVGASLDDELNALAEGTDPAGAIVALLTESSGVALKLWMLNKPSVLLEGAMAQLARPTDTLGRLFAAGQLAAAQRDPAVRGRAAEIRTRVLGEIAAANPSTFELSALPVIDEIERGERLSPVHVRRLLEALSLDVRVELAGRLYADLVKQRRAATGLTKRLAWLDAVTVLPDPAFTIWRYAKDAEKTPDLLRLAEQLGARDAASLIVMRRVIGLELLRMAASPADTVAHEALSVRLASTRQLMREENRFDPDWPLDPVLADVTDALARDEIGLLTRCLFPNGV